MLGFPGAAQAVSICEGLVKAQASADAAAEDVDWIAEALSSVGFFLEPCRHGREPGEEAIALFFRRYEKRNQPRTPDSTLRIEFLRPRAPLRLLHQPPARAQGLMPSSFQISWTRRTRSCRPSRASCRMPGKPHDQEALTTVRRAFHTLKGSGRMVGLMDLGEAAWRVERGPEHLARAKARSTRRSSSLWRRLGFVRRVDRKAARARPRRPGRRQRDRGAGGAGEQIYRRRRCRRASRSERHHPARALRHLHQRSRRAHQGAPSGMPEVVQALWPTFRGISSVRRTRSRDLAHRGFIPLADLAGALEQWTQFAKETVDAADVDHGSNGGRRPGQDGRRCQQGRTRLRSSACPGTRCGCYHASAGGKAGAPAGARSAAARRARKAQHARRHRRAATAGLHRGSAAARARNRL